MKPTANMDTGYVLAVALLLVFAGFVHKRNRERDSLRTELDLANLKAEYYRDMAQGWKQRYYQVTGRSATADVPSVNVKLEP